MPVRTYALSATVLLAAVPAFAQAPKWETFVSKAGGFSVLLPAKPVEQSRSDKDGPLTFNTTMYIGRSANLSCVASCTFLPSGTTDQVIRNMKGGVKVGLLNQVNGTKQTEGPATYGGLKGERMTFEMDGGQGSLWMVVAKQKLIVLSIGMRGKRNAEAEKKFFTSFKFAK
jgi:hypothetical protein